MGGEIVLWRVPLRWFGPVLLGLGFQIVLQLGREHVLSQRLLYLVDQPDSHRIDSVSLLETWAIN
ncbi:hypothetical protein NCPPB3923_24055 [Burkholderia glumae]|nr:hypothetical protein NCPPB3923_24055 [Burkholderia glumae]